MKKLLILSGKGGTGKTTVAAAFVRFSRASAVADCDVDAPNLNLLSDFQGHENRNDFFGAQKAFIDGEKCINCGSCAAKCRFSAIKKENEGYYIEDIACEGCALCTAVCPVNAISMVDDVAGSQSLIKEDKDNKPGRIFSTAKLKTGRGNSGKLVTAVKTSLFKAVEEEKVKRAARSNDVENYEITEKAEIDKGYFNPSGDLAVIDGSPGIGCPVIASVAGVDLLLIVAEPSISGFSDLSRLLSTAGNLQCKSMVCVNKWDISKEFTQKIKSFCREKDVPFAGCIPYDKTVIQAVNQGLSVADFDSPSSEGLRKVYKNVLAEIAK